MAKKKAATKKPAGRKSATTKSSATKKTASGRATKKKTASGRKKPAAAAARKTSAKKKKKPAAKSPAKKKAAAAKKKTVKKPAARTRTARQRSEGRSARQAPARRKGVRRATTTSGIRSSKPARKLGRSQIPIDAPLDIVFQNDPAAREAFVFLGIHTVRELEEFEPDELVRQLTSPAKQTVGRIRKILAMNNRSLMNDEAFALEFKERLAQTQMMK